MPCLEEELVVVSVLVPTAAEVVWQKHTPTHLHCRSTLQVQAVQTGKQVVQVGSSSSPHSSSLGMATCVKKKESKRQGAGG